jgi:choline kinase
MKLIVLASGTSSRLLPITQNIPKCLLQIGGEPLIVRLIRQFRSLVSEVIITTGYKRECIENHPELLSYKKFFFADYFRFNNLHTLLSVSNEFDQDCIIAFSDIFLSASAFSQIANNLGGSHSVLFVDTSRVLEGTMAVEVASSKINGICLQEDRHCGNGNFIGLGYFKKADLENIRLSMELIKEKVSDKYYTYVVDRLVKENKLNLVACDIQGHLWAEIDTSEDLLSLRQIEGD